MNDAYDEGYTAFELDIDSPPAHYTEAEKRAWYRGWDSASDDFDEDDLDDYSNESEYSW